MEIMELKAQARKKGERLVTGMIPAIAYNKGKNINLAIERKQFDKIFRQQGVSGLFEILLEGEQEPIPALVKTVQMDKRRRIPIHVDFFIVTYGQQIEANVPVHFTGQDTAPGVKAGGMVDLRWHNIPVLAPGPRSIPSEIVIDVSKMEIGDNVHSSDLNLPEGVELTFEEDVTILSMLPPRLTEEELEALDEAAAKAGEEAAEGSEADENADEHEDEDKPKEGTEGRNLDKDSNQAEEIRSESGQE